MSLKARLARAKTIDEVGGINRLLRDQIDAKLIECLDDGFVKLVDHMGDDAAVCQAARVSYGAGTKSVSDDRGLIRYLMRQWHTTPFEMAEFKFLVRVPMDCWRQWIRHRTASVNEYSTRYSEAIDSQQQAEVWRTQATSNKQGSAGEVTDWPKGYELRPRESGGVNVINDEGVHTIDFSGQPESPAYYLGCREFQLQNLSDEVYQERLKFGVAREQARKDLPLSTYTEAYWKVNLHNLLHFLRLRMDGHAQLEIRTYANAIGDLIKGIVPWTWEAFQDYRLQSMQLTRLDILVIQGIQAGKPWTEIASEVGMGKREIVEFEVKALKLGFIL